MTREAIEKLVRRGRGRLETMRYLRDSARGALAGGALGLVLLAANRLGLAMPGWVPWALPAAGAVVGLVAALLTPRVRLASAALYLDARLDTDERLVTVVTREPGPFSARLLGELRDVRRLPRVPVPREVSLVPAALFLLFAVGLLPRANGAPGPVSGEELPPSPSIKPHEVDGQRPADMTEAAARLARGVRPEAAELRDLQRVLEDAVFSPEERRAALAELKRAAEGDGDAAKRVASILKAAQGGGGRQDTTSEPRTPEARAGGGAADVTAYPEHRELVLAYRRALAEEKDR